MTPEQIAAKLTPAQVRALPAWRNATTYLGGFLVAVSAQVKWMRPISTALVRKGLLLPDKEHPGIKTITPLGREVLAVLDGGKP